MARKLILDLSVSHDRESVFSVFTPSIECSIYVTCPFIDGYQFKMLPVDLKCASYQFHSADSPWWTRLGRTVLVVTTLVMHITVLSNLSNYITVLSNQLYYIKVLSNLSNSI